METTAPRLTNNSQDSSKFNISSYKPHLFSDGEYQVNSFNNFMAVIPANISLLCNLNLKEKTKEWSNDFSEIINQGRVSYLNITGENRSRAFSLMLYQGLPNKLKVILSKKKLSVEDLILKEVGFVLSRDFIKSLPENLDFPERFKSIPTILKERLYYDDAKINYYEMNSDSLL